MASVHGNKLVCSQCNFETGRRDTMELHSRMHQATKNYACDKCECKYYTQNSLYTHKKLKHSPEATKENEEVMKTVGSLKRKLEEAHQEIRMLREML